MNMLQRLVILAGMVTIAGCAATDSRAVGDSSPKGGIPTGIRPFVVELEIVESNTTALQVMNEETVGCEQFPDLVHRKGCIVAPYNDTVEVEVILNTDDWHLDAFQICAGRQKPSVNAAGNPSNKPEMVCQGNLSDKKRSDWLILANNDVALPDKSGRVDLSQFNVTALKKFVIRDMNWTKASYFYGIRACEDANPSNCIWTDPGGQNNGRGWVSGSN